MKYCIITFRSVTPAQRAEESLRRAGFACTLQRTPKELSVRGCGYCLGLHPGQVGWAAQLLDAEKVDYGKLYASTAEGYEELHL